MAPHTDRNRPAAGRRLLTRLGLVGALLLGIGACSGGSCGNCSSFEQKKFPKKHYDKTVPRSGQVRVTKEGLDFFETELPNLVEQLRPGGLNFCVPRTEQSGATICGVDTCNNGSTGCQLDLELQDAELVPSPPDTIRVEVTIAKINEVLPFDYDTFLGTVNCKADLHRDGASNDTPASVKAKLPIELQIDQQSPTKNVTIEAGQVQADLGSVAIDIDGRGGTGDDIACEGADTIVKPFVRGTIDDRLKTEVNKAIQQIVREQTCTPCGSNQPACPSTASCETFDGSSFCAWNSDGTCVSKPLGTQGRLLLGSALGAFMEPKDANVDLLARAADMADVDSGVSIGLRTGFQQDRIRECAPVDPAERPSLSSIQPSMKILSNKQPNTNDPFMVGIGIHENTIEQALWTSWASGATCLRIGSSFNDALNTTALKLFMPSIENLAEQKSPVYLRVAPQTAPNVELGDNEVVKSGDSYELKTPMMTIDWDDLDLHFYAFVEDRFARLYTTRLDLELPIGLTTNDKGQLVPVIGNLEEAPQNIRVRNHRLLSEEKKKLKEVVPTLLSTALPQLTGSLSEPIDLPAFYGYQLVLNKEDITAVDNDTFLALFANLKPATQTNTHLAELTPEIVGSDVDAEAPTGEEIPDPLVRLDLRAGTNVGVAVPADDVEFSYRIDGGFWSMFHRSRELEIRHPLLRLQGEHEVEVRARYTGVPGTASEPVSTTVAVDFGAPSVELRRDGRDVRVEARDAVDSPAQMQYRYRATSRDGATVAGWTAWGGAQTIDLTRFETDRPVRLTVEARDRAGYVGRASETFHTDPRVLASSSGTAGSGSQSGASSTGCSVAPGSNQGGPVGFLWLLGLGLLGLRTRRIRRSRSGIVFISAALLALTCGVGCNNDISEGEGPRCDPACSQWEECVDGSCESKSCETNEDCPGESVCADGACIDRECSSSADCSCPGDEDALCREGACVCKNFCPDGCGEGEYCCYAENACKSIPNPCAEKSCEAGFEAKVVSRGTANSSECTVSGGSCECVETEPLPLEWYGEYTSIDSNADRTDCTDCVVAVSTYNKSYGDVMVGVIGEDLTPQWYVPDGVPSDGKVVAAPSGPRGGIRDNGPDVGTYTAIAVDGSDRLHVFYRSEEEEHLKYARGTGSEGDYSFETTTVDDSAGSGLYTAAAIGPDGALHAFYGVQDVEVEYKGETIDGSEFRHVSFPPDTDLENLAAEPEVVAIGGRRNPCVSCPSGESCFTDNATCAASTSDCDGSCGDGEKCRNGSCEPVFQEVGTPSHRLMTGLYPEIVRRSSDLLVLYYDHVEQRIEWVTGTTGNWSAPKPLGAATGPYASGAVDSNGGLHVAYMDGDSQSLRYRPPGQNGTETIVDGTRDTGTEYLRSAIGEDVQIWLGPSGTPNVVFQDATRHRYLHAARAGSNSWTTDVLTTPTDSGAYAGARGFYSGAAAATGGDKPPIVVEYVIDQQADPSEGYLEFLRLE